MNNQPFLSVIIPCYNEKENIRRGVINQVYDYLKKQKYTWEIIVSDDGSTDNSRELVTQYLKGKINSRLLKNTHGGKPHAVWCGIKEAKGEYILFDDMDQSTPIYELDKFAKYFDKYDAIIGSRGLARKNFSIIRKVGSAVFTTIRKNLLLRQIGDTQCGFKSMRRQVAMQIFPLLEFFNDKKPVKGWKVTSFDVELLFLINKYGYSIKEIPVEWHDEDISTGKGKSYIKESKEMLKQILRVKLNDLRGYYYTKAKTST